MYRGSGDVAAGESEMEILVRTVSEETEARKDKPVVGLAASQFQCCHVTLCISFSEVGYTDTDCVGGRAGIV